MDPSVPRRGVERGKRPCVQFGSREGSSDPSSMCTEKESPGPCSIRCGGRVSRRTSWVSGFDPGEEVGGSKTIMTGKREGRDHLLRQIKVIKVIIRDPQES